MVRRLPPPGPEPDLGIGFTSAQWDHPTFLPYGQITTAHRMPTVALARSGPVLTLPVGVPLDVDALDFTDPLTGRAMTGSQFLDRRLAIDGLLVVHDGSVRYETYRNGLRPDDHHVLHSCSKTLTTMAVGIAIHSGQLDPQVEVAELLPVLGNIEAWRGVRVQHVLDMATGHATDEHYADPDSMYWRYAKAAGYAGDAPPGASVIDFVASDLRTRAHPPGHRFEYASYLTNLLPACLSVVTGRPAAELYEEQLHQRIGAEQDALVNTDPVGNPIVEGQLNLTLRDFARWALLYLDDGRNLGGDQVVPAAWIDEAFTLSSERRDAFARGESAAAFPGAEYHNQAWLLDPEHSRLAMLGIHGQFAYIDRPNRLLIVGLGSYPVQLDGLLTASTSHLWHRITAALGA